MTNPTNTPAASGETGAPKFAVDDPVQKSSGYRYPGIVRSVYQNGAGETRYDVEADHPDFRGMLHIFSEAQLERREPVAVAGETGAAKMREACAQVAAEDRDEMLDKSDKIRSEKPNVADRILSEARAATRIRDKIRALSLPPDPHSERIAALTEVARMVDRWGHGLRHRTAHESAMVKAARDALARINSTLGEPR